MKKIQVNLYMKDQDLLQQVYLKNLSLSPNLFKTVSFKLLYKNNNGTKPITQSSKRVR